MEMQQAAADLDFERAAAIRDDIRRLREAGLVLPAVSRGDQ